jgi:hypothetical protein
MLHSEVDRVVVASTVNGYHLLRKLSARDLRLRMLLATSTKQEDIDPFLALQNVVRQWVVQDHEPLRLLELLLLSHKHVGAAWLFNS